jgi:hypothetical protein
VQQAALKTAPAGNCYGLNARVAMALAWVWTWRPDAGASEGKISAAGHTQIRKVLAHARKEHSRERVGALILVSDACQELPADLYAEARELAVPVFLFQEGNDERIAGIYREVANLTGGASCRFDANASQRLAELLKAVAAFAIGGVAQWLDEQHPLQLSFEI